MKRKALPTWPHPGEVRLTAHRNGQWCKKVKGKIRYFGPWSDVKGALKRYRAAVAGGLHDGVAVPTSAGDTVTISEVFDAYLAARRGDMDTGRRADRTDNERAIGPAMFKKYIRAGQIVAKALEPDTPADSLRPADFARVLAELKSGYGSATRAGYITAIRTVLTWAANIELIPHVPAFGPDFRGGTGIKLVRRQRREGRKKFIEADVLRKLMQHASPAVRCMIRLGLNCGFYAIDCSDLLASDIDMKAGIIRMERHKTEVDRVAVLWPETLADLKLAIATRPKPADPSHDGHVFITRRGKLWVKTQSAKFDHEQKLVSVTHNDYVAQEFLRLFKKAGIERPQGCTFAWLRHTFYTIARRTGKIDAVNAMMGHEAGGMTSHYLETVDVDDYADLRYVADYMRRWVTGESAAVLAKIG